MAAKEAALLKAFNSKDDSWRPLTVEELRQEAALAHSLQAQSEKNLSGASTVDVGNGSGRSGVRQENVPEDRRDRHEALSRTGRRTTKKKKRVNAQRRKF